MMRREARVEKQYDDGILLQLTMQRGRGQLIYLDDIEHTGRRRLEVKNDGDSDVHGWVRSDRR